MTRPILLSEILAGLYLKAWSYAGGITDPVIHAPWPPLPRCECSEILKPGHPDAPWCAVHSVGRGRR